MLQLLTTCYIDQSNKFVDVVGITIVNYFLLRLKKSMLPFNGSHLQKYNFTYFLNLNFKDYDLN